MAWSDFVAGYGPLPELPTPEPTDYTWGRELAALLCLARGRRRFLEFGTARGRTTLALARANPQAEIVTVDVDAALVADDQYQRCDVRPRGEVGIAFRGTVESERIRQVWVSPAGPHDREALMSGGRFDWVFIDSLHSYEGVRRDWLGALGVLGGGGVIVWDDYLGGGVPVLLEELRGRGWAVVHVAETRLCYWIADDAGIAG